MSNEKVQARQFRENYLVEGPTNEVEACKCDSKQLSLLLIVGKFLLCECSVLNKQETVQFLLDARIQRIFP
jgi:hypothetical protein